MDMIMSSLQSLARSASLPDTGGGGELAQIDRQIRQLQKRRMTVSKEMAEVATSDASPDEKKERLAMLSKEMAMIDAQINMLMNRKKQILEDKQRPKENSPDRASDNLMETLEPQQSLHDAKVTIDIRI
ncbi:MULTISPECIES: FlxA-like family protein [unclassified Paenibacillus]|uniref:FlxA-like family protein n=1 Tax=unclassified Paenibacillus TaxID=185978 RepID=UPI001C0F82C4|nr:MULTISPECIES: FlxA-like family protein [unclassified Paenibacillus]MBU5441659.1 FlxA-like family protein [Paenibacillus sp. MSJ-34]CAH0118152.1 hypothetical protein PAE9249_00618 [Paenibacillus sp. CECT 9249]